MGKLTLVRPSDLQESVAALIAGTDGSNRRKQLLASSSPTPLLHGIEEVRHLRKTGGAVLETLFDRITNMQHLNAAVPSTDKALHAPSTISSGNPVSLLLDTDKISNVPICPIEVGKFAILFL